MKILIFLLFLCNFIFADNDLSLEKIFKKNKVKGTIVIQSLSSNKSYVFNPKRANTRLLPASTFKIPNSLIVLDTKVIKDEKEIILWDRKKRFLDVWNKNQTLKTAFKYSCVWCYQYFASKLSLDIYNDYLIKLKYGNMKTGNNLTGFWLSGDIKISSYEQIEFLKKLYTEKLPFKSKHLKLVKKIMIEEKNNKYILHAKTGWATSPENKHGWYVGYIETSKDTWFFSTNLLISDFKRLYLRKELTLEVFKYYNII
ncbi:class D beta-lactamase [Arcobacter sp. CECT 8989]|uniref:class D beta-lactamase n=1 Tax=Arcobacter sp. CECT 8989 TaxID=2044509 RepID=UPI00100AFAF5|nr:class D beta-lactamase [Arcobacter sp. CECT 8989]RXK03997.1 class D beta-lactamase [Arcobacter sp. CECT 8989]